MTHAEIKKFPETGINHVIIGDALYAPGVMGVDVLVQGAVRRNQLTALAHDRSRPIQPTERQQYVMNNLALPAIADTVSEVFGERVSIPPANRLGFRLLAREDFAKYHGDNFAGLYYPDRDLAVLNQGNYSPDSPEGLAYVTKVRIHEDFHRLSHQLAKLYPTNNSLHMQRFGANALGKDMRERNKGGLTWDYFLPLNEAITEMLAIETYQKIADHPIFKKPDGSPAVPYQTYPEYRGLLNAAMDDAIHYKSTTLSREDLWRLICRGQLTGNIEPLVQLRRVTYPGLTGREFGLMTSAEDLPKEGDFIYQPASLTGRTISEEYRRRLHNLFNNKTSQDYVTDVAPSSPPPASSAVKDVSSSTHLHSGETNPPNDSSSGNGGRKPRYVEDDYGDGGYEDWGYEPPRTRA